jgi:prepilin-type N-terminal cleavage/methylation domain-containing protein
VELDPTMTTSRNEQGFSLLELMIAMTVTLVIMGVASTLLATSFHVRTREHSRTDAIADVQRALNIMSREIALGGYGFDTTSNGLVAEDCDATTIRVRSNLNRYSDYSTTIESSGEDVKYLVDATDGQNYLVRHDQFPAIGSNQSTVLANKINTLTLVYYSATNAELDPADVADAVRVRIRVTADLLAVGNPGTPGHQPATTIELSSDVALRNKTQNLSTY